MGFLPVEGDIRQLVGTESLRQVADTGNNPILFSFRFRRAARPLVQQAVKDMLAACRGAQAAVLAGLGQYGGCDVAEKLSLPFVTAAVQPMFSTRTIHSPFFPPAPAWLPFKGSYNRLTYSLLAWMLWSFVRSSLSKARCEILDLGAASFAPPFDKLARQGVPSLVGVSPAVISKPYDWPSAVDLTGYWFLDSPASETLPVELERFIGSGPPPVYIGFGSLSDREAEIFTQIAIDALKQAGQRGVLLTGWGGLHGTSRSDDLLAIDFAPHKSLFPRMAAVVHHGGAGTTAAGLRAGAPNVIVPFMGDQPFWGRRVYELGVGAAPIPRAELSTQRSADAISTVVHDQGIRARAAQLGEKIRAEDGIGRAVEKINQYFGGT